MRIPGRENKKLQETGDPLAIAAMSAGALVVTVLGAVGGWIGYSALGVNHRLPLPEAIAGQRHTFIGPRTGMMSYYADRSAGLARGRPLVLIHGFNVAASAYEMRPLFLHYRVTRAVYAPDMPGFGFSDRSKRVYSPHLYTDAIIDFLQTQVQHGPADVIALSLGSEFAARAALERPDLIHSLTFISPSGFSAPDDEYPDGHSDDQSRQAGQTSYFNRTERLYARFAFPLWRQAFYDLLTTPISLRYFLKQSFVGRVDQGLLDYDYATSHQPGAKNAPLYFISGKLFSPDIRREVYEKLTQPVLVLFDRDPFVRFDMLPVVVRAHDNWRSVRITPTKGLPHFEKLDETARALDEFWEQVKTA